jgi:septum formation protein
LIRLVLASASPARLAVLRSAGIEPIVRVSDVDEDAVARALGPAAAPETVVTELARAKARAVLDRLNAESGPLGADHVIVGCDSMLFIHQTLQGKPPTTAAARERWQSMAGSSGQLLTGHCVLRPDGAGTHADAAACSTTTVHFGSPSAAELDAYLASGEPLQVAGAFTLDGLGGWFVDRIEGDPSSVIGIGLPLMRSLLARVGVGVADLWTGR